MSVIKCKMCGGDLELIEGSSVAVCEYCGTQQTVPAADNEKKLTLFARANRLRLACEFDKAAGVYESIVADFPTEAEAYWGLVLCRYGIEYVDDPATGKKIPTCHRSSFDSVMEDSDFEQALENADAVARRVYRDEAKAIEELRRGIVEVSGKEPPYDIFICYKETAEDGQRTVDSVIAQDVYDALTEKGYRVFFSRISLEDKLGTEYEPYIFAALHSAKIMLAFGTDYEYYNAVWVKNEWSRYLQLMTKDKSKHLIPCYKNLDAYDMPKEFAKLQAQDMGKVGAMQDLLRGVDKIMGRDKAAPAPTAAPAASTAAPTSATAESLLKRVFMFLEDGDWNSADEYCEKVLDLDPENARAYFGKLMTELHVRKVNDLKNCQEPFDNSNNYRKAVRFGDEELCGTLEGCVAYIKQRNEETRLAALYTSAKAVMASANSEETFQHAAERFAQISGYKDAVDQREECLRRAAKLAEENRKLEEIRRKERQEKFRLLAQRRAVIAPYQKLIAAGTHHTVALMNTGKVLAVGWNDTGRCKVGDWKGIVALAAEDHTVGLMADGRVTAIGYNAFGQCRVDSWRDIAAIAVGERHTVGQKADGTVIAVGDNGSGQCNVGGWQDIAAIAADGLHTVGLKTNGTVVAVGSNKHGECNVGEWRGIVAIAAGNMHTVGLKSDGTVVAVGDNMKGNGQCNVGLWQDIVAVAAGDGHTVGLKSDGTVVAVGGNGQGNGQCNVGQWRDIVAIAAGGGHTVGLKSNGTVVATGAQSYEACNVEDWKLFFTREDLIAEREALAAELANLKGLFSGVRRKEIENRLAEIETELKRL